MNTTFSDDMTKINHNIDINIGKSISANVTVSNQFEKLVSRLIIVYKAFEIRESLPVKTRTAGILDFTWGKLRVNRDEPFLA